MSAKNLRQDLGDDYQAIIEQISWQVKILKNSQRRFGFPYLNAFAIICKCYIDIQKAGDDTQRNRVKNTKWWISSVFGSKLGSNRNLGDEEWYLFEEDLRIELDIGQKAKIPDKIRGLLDILKHKEVQKQIVEEALCEIKSTIQEGYGINEG